jgi:hypothetical protein
MSPYPAIEVTIGDKVLHPINSIVITGTAVFVTQAISMANANALSITITVLTMLGPDPELYTWVEQSNDLENWSDVAGLDDRFSPGTLTQTIQNISAQAVRLAFAILPSSGNMAIVTGAVSTKRL